MTNCVSAAIRNGGSTQFLKTQARGLPASLERSVVQHTAIAAILAISPPWSAKNLISSSLVNFSICSAVTPMPR
ncbi:MAG: hypothetical protein IJQ13_00185 [Prevotella sp.]|nr:hypothetical protein [Prevotella sp.]